MIDLLLTAGIVITVDRANRVVEDGAVAIDAGRIVAVGPSDEVVPAHQAQRRIDRPTGVAMPGLVDAHGHAGHSLIRTMADDLAGWMDACDRVYRHGATPQFWRAEAELTALEKLMAGTTTSLSMFGGSGDTIRVDSPEHCNGHLEAYAGVGVRALAAVGPGAPPFPKVTTHREGATAVERSSSFDDQMAVVATLISNWRDHRLCSVALTYPTLDLDDVGIVLDPELVSDAAAVRELSEQEGLLIVQDGHRAASVDMSSRLGLLGPRTLLSHAVDLDPSHIQLLADAGAGVAHNPSAIFSQFGRCPVPELLAAGVKVGLGSDATAPDRSADMFRHMYQLTRYHRADRHDPALFPPGTTLRMATMGSAAALGMDDDVGSLEVGKAADVIVVETAKPHLTPFTHPVHQLVYFATGADVETVIVDGEVLMQDRSVATVDTSEVLDAARREQALAFDRVGIRPANARDGLWTSVRYPDGSQLEI
jgi:cytosine/adenosine deaminase-related metal-dependent hydrolase